MAICSSATFPFALGESTMSNPKHLTATANHTTRLGERDPHVDVRFSTALPPNIQQLLESTLASLDRDPFGPDNPVGFWDEEEQCWCVAHAAWPTVRDVLAGAGVIITGDEG
jgi:hypothetical protein